MQSTVSEKLFEVFCAQHLLQCHRVAETSSKTPDYHLQTGDTVVGVEIKQIESDRGINPTDGTWSRTIGWHVRQKITEARAQMGVVARAGMPAVLLIYNTVDPLQGASKNPSNLPSLT
ncbi:hypothetical protein ACFQS6_07305 [Xanthomonas populi]|uniref:Uncharacterized protein n=1 Tax=Xanthomonas populi TaxID=53414 RepID=A0A2S7EH90_9XANT|nr:hypothetical protein [Xanthomonas populi]PPU89556.1 hypothetical protein XpopCFBP1817_17090 [Xanthomonas populi]